MQPFRILPAMLLALPSLAAASPVLPQTAPVLVLDINQTATPALRDPPSNPGDFQATVLSGNDGKYGNEFWMVDPGAVAQEIGQSCGARGMRLRGTDPVLGASMTFALEDAVPNKAGLFLMSFVPARPIDLGRGCIAYVDLMMPLLLLGIGTDAQGKWSMSAVVPTNPALKSLLLAIQLAVGPTATPPMGTDLSNGLFISPGK